MKKNNILKKLLCLLIVLTLFVGYFPNTASASQITNRSVKIGSSEADLSSTTYDFLFTLPSTSAVKSVSFAACLSASGACNPVPGFDASSSTLTSQPTNLGSASGWTSNGIVGALRISNSGNSISPTPATPTSVMFSGVHNPSAENSTFFIRITTFSDDNYINAIDTGVVATSTAGQVLVLVNIDEQLTFTLASSTVNLTTPTVASTGHGTTSMTLSTNASSGYSLSYEGNTLTSGANTITPLGVASGSVVNSKQFGFNLMNNANPAVGASVSGSGSGLPTVGYNTSDIFKFNSGDIIATASSPTNTNTYTASYIVNMDGSTAAGVYSTYITYIATANF